MPPDAPPPPRVAASRPSTRRTPRRLPDLRRRLHADGRGAAATHTSSSPATSAQKEGVLRQTMLNFACRHLETGYNASFLMQLRPATSIG